MIFISSHYVIKTMRAITFIYRCNSNKVICGSYELLEYGEADKRYIFIASVC